MSKLFLVRHGLTEFNSTRRFAGHTDVELNTDGYRQVEMLRDHLVNEKIDAVYSSDLKRAVATAEVVSTGHEVDIITCPELREINYGDAEGLTFQQIRESYPEVSKLIASSFMQLKFPGGEGWKDFIERTIKFLDRLEKHETSETIMIVAHSGPLRVLVCHLLGIDQSHWRQIRCDNASLSILHTYPQQAIISLLNGTYHLKEAS